MMQVAVKFILRLADLSGVSVRRMAETVVRYPGIAEKAKKEAKKGAASVANNRLSTIQNGLNA